MEEPYKCKYKTSIFNVYIKKREMNVRERKRTRKNCPRQYHKQSLRRVYGRMNNNNSDLFLLNFINSNESSTHGVSRDRLVNLCRLAVNSHHNHHHHMNA